MNPEFMNPDREQLLKSARLLREEASKLEVMANRLPIILEQKTSLTLREAGVLFDRSPDYLRKLVHQGKIPFTKRNSRLILLQQIDLQTYMANTKRGGTRKAS